MTPQSSNESESDKQIVESEFKRTHSKDEEVQSILKQSCSETKNHESELDEPESKQEEASQSNCINGVGATLHLEEPSATAVMEKTRTSRVHSDVEARQAGAVEESGRERLKRHRVEVADRVWIPDMWGQEELLKDWIDCSAFDDVRSGYCSLVINDYNVEMLFSLSAQGKQPEQMVLFPSWALALEFGEILSDR